MKCLAETHMRIESPEGEPPLRLRVRCLKDAPHEGEPHGFAVYDTNVDRMPLLHIEWE